MNSKLAHDESKLARAIREIERDHPLPRCAHGQALRDHSGEKLEPSCGCRWSRSALTSLLAEFVAELDRVNAKFPDARRLPDGTGGGGRKTWDTLARNSCERAQREGRLTHTHVYDKETAEVMAAETVEELRKELVQVGATTIKWLLDIDSR